MRQPSLPICILVVCAGACSSAIAPQDAQQGKHQVARYWLRPDPILATAPSSGGHAGATAPKESPRSCTQLRGRIFPSDVAWNQSIRAAPLAPDSAQIVSYLSKNHAERNRFRIDFSITVLDASKETPRLQFLPTGDFHSPDCDVQPMPVPPEGVIEGESGYACERDGDCHLIVYDRTQCRLYEMWRADLRNGQLRGGCLAVWDTSLVYPDNLRGEGCASADAAGLPIAPLLFTPVEIHAGKIEHAIRFVLPDANIRERTYVRPATHSAGPTSGPDDAPPYGSRMRLRESFDASEFGRSARIVIEALKEYGMILADSGRVTFTAASDRRSAYSWQELGLGSEDLTRLSWSDFEAVDAGPTKRWSGECRRNTLSP